MVYVGEALDVEAGGTLDDVWGCAEVMEGCGEEFGDFGGGLGEVGSLFWGNGFVGDGEADETCGGGSFC